MKVIMKKDVFLSNPYNNKRFLDMLQHYLAEGGFTLQSEGNAVLIVKTVQT